MRVSRCQSVGYSAMVYGGATPAMKDSYKCGGLIGHTLWIRRCIGLQCTLLSREKHINPHNRISKPVRVLVFWVWRLRI